MTYVQVEQSHMTCSLQYPKNQTSQEVVLNWFLMIYGEEECRVQERRYYHLTQETQALEKGSARKSLVQRQNWVQRHSQVSAALVTAGAVIPALFCSSAVDTLATPPAQLDVVTPPQLTPSQVPLLLL